MPMTPFRKPHTGPCPCATCTEYIVFKSWEALREALTEAPNASNEVLEARATELLAENSAEAQQKAGQNT